MKILKVISIIISVVGFFLVVGAAGGGDLGTLEYKQIFVQAIIGLTMWIGGFKIWVSCV